LGPKCLSRTRACSSLKPSVLVSRAR
jgi:hypothetical protein